MRHSDPAIYAWFLHRGMADAVLDDDSGSLRRFARRVRARDANGYASEIEQWLRHVEVVPLQALILHNRVSVGGLTWLELPFEWSEVAAERRRFRDGDTEVRCSFNGMLEIAECRGVRVHGTFNPGWVTCSTSNVELRGVRSQYVLGHIAATTKEAVEIRPIVIATRLFAPGDQQWRDHRWQRVDPSLVDQFANIDWTTPIGHGELEALRVLPEASVKTMLAEVIGEPVVPNDWGGEQCDLWTTRLRVDGRAHSAAFLLKGPSRFKPMTIGMLGKNGDQLERLARTSAEILVVQHCHEIRPEVHALLRSLASDYRHVRRYLLLDGFDTFRLAAYAGLVE